jgi:hypothetical protein
MQASLLTATVVACSAVIVKHTQEKKIWSHVAIFESTRNVQNGLEQNCSNKTRKMFIISSQPKEMLFEPVQINIQNSKAIKTWIKRKKLQIF